jgi:hypothetical protein
VGDTFPRIASPSEVRQHEVLAHDHVAIGTLHASCQEERVQERGTTVSVDLPCSERLLYQHLRSRASQQGGTVLVAPTCTSTVGKTPEGDDDSGWVLRRVAKAECRATVARPRSTIPGGGALSVPSIAPAEKLVQLTLRGVPVHVLVRPSPNAPLVPPRALAQVERGYAPAAGGSVLAQVRSICQKPCDRGVAEEALLHGGAAAGADLLTDVRCLSIRTGVWACDGAAMQAVAPSASNDSRRR